MNALLYLVGKHEICSVLTHFFKIQNILPAPDSSTDFATYLDENTVHNSIIINIMPSNQKREFPSVSQSKGRVISCLLLDTIDDAIQWVVFQKTLAIKSRKGISILAQWNPHYLHIGNLWLKALRKNKALKSKDWMADKVGKSHLLDYLAKGSQTCVYFGHGRPQKMVGYHGISGEEICQSDKNISINCFLSFSCYHLHHDPEHLSFGEILIKSHIVAAFLGSRIATDKMINAQLAKICLYQYTSADNIVMSEWINNVSKAVKRESNPLLSTLWKSYSLLGNPLLPLN